MVDVAKRLSLGGDIPHRLGRFQCAARGGHKALRSLPKATSK
jgi:hypothetical protein